MTKGLTKQARVLTDRQQDTTMKSIADRPTAARDRVMLLLSWKAGLRAKEISNITWAMVTDSDGAVGDVLTVTNAASKGRHGGRTIPTHGALRAALAALKPDGVASDARIILDRRGYPVSANGTVQWFHRLYAGLGFDGASSHSGRRTFITKAARTITQCGGSLRDVQALAGHSSLSMTALYIDQSTDAQARAIRMM